MLCSREGSCRWARQWRDSSRTSASSQWLECCVMDIRRSWLVMAGRPQSLLAVYHRPNALTDLGHKCLAGDFVLEYFCEVLMTCWMLRWSRPHFPSQGGLFPWRFMITLSHQWLDDMCLYPSCVADLEDIVIMMRQIIVQSSFRSSYPPLWLLRVCTLLSWFKWKCCSSCSWRRAPGCTVKFGRSLICDTRSDVSLRMPTVVSTCHSIDNCIVEIVYWLTSDLRTRVTSAKRVPKRRQHCDRIRRTISVFSSCIHTHIVLHWNPV